MERHVFRMDILGSIFASAVMLSLSGFAVYNLIATQNYLNIILIIIPLLFFIPLYKRRVVIEDRTLYCKKKQVNLEQVSAVVFDHVSESTHLGSRSDRHLFLLDKEDNVLGHFDRDYIKGQKQEEFIKAVKAANPDIEIDI